MRGVGKLSNLRVLDLSMFLPGPMLTGMMADQGAEVLKIEPPAGDPARGMEPIEAGHSVWFRQMNRGKKSEVVDLKSVSGKARLTELVESADVFVEGFRPGVMARLGFGPARLTEINPRIVSCSISAFGADGPLAHHPAHDMAVQAMAGFLSVNDSADGTPVVPGVPSADMAAGLTGLSAVLMALLARERTGCGDHIDLAMFDSLLPWSAHIAGAAIAGGAPPRSKTQRSLGGAALYQVYRTADDRHVVLAGREEKFAQALFTALERPDLITVALAPAGEQAAAIAFLRDTFASRTQTGWRDWFEGRDIAFAPVLDFTEVLRGEQATHRSLWNNVSGAHHLAPAIRFENEAWSPTEPPALGQ